LEQNAPVFGGFHRRGSTRAPSARQTSSTVGEFSRLVRAKRVPVVGAWLSVEPHRFGGASNDVALEHAAMLGKKFEIAAAAFHFKNNLIIFEGGFLDLAGRASFPARHTARQPVSFQTQGEARLKLAASKG